MSDTKTPGEKKLSVSKLTLKPRIETGVVRQSFSHGRSKQVVVEKVKRRVVGGDGRPESTAPVSERSSPAQRGAPGKRKSAGSQKKSGSAAQAARSRSRSSARLPKRASARRKSVVFAKWK